MPKLCEATALYLGSVGPIARVYNRNQMIWPCWNCSIVDPEFAKSTYLDALMYVPKVCIPITAGVEFEIKDAVHFIPITPGDAYNNMFNYSGVTWGFSPPVDSDLYGEVVVEADLPAIVDTVGVVDSSVSFFLEIDEEIGVDDVGVLVKVEDMEIELRASAFGGTQILARVPGTPDPIEVQSTTDLTLDKKTLISIAYQVGIRLTIYYDYEKVGETLL